MIIERQALYQQLPDIPRFVETRALLLEADIFIVDEDADLAKLGSTDAETICSFIVADTEDEFASVIGNVSKQKLLDGVKKVDELLAFPENIQHLTHCLPQWEVEEVRVHKPKNTTVFASATDNCRLLNQGELIEFDHINAEFMEELSGVDNSGRPIAAAFDSGLPVAFCYPTCYSETLWDVSIDTLPSHRRRGFAQQASLTMIEHLATRKLNPMWCAVELNPSSWLLAEKLGFERVDTIYLLTSP